MDKFVYDFGNSSSLGEFHAGWFSVTIMTGMISVVVQTFFAWRICKLSTSRLWGGCIISVRYRNTSWTVYSLPEK
ncbi:hypothetical protein IEO21_03602 [Rhodonia placenta]|uniref:Uncharacterized protein n=1 Tax=Rhodonia placenta TaxID=104341 RepID=A0A8H7P5I5_9APHY|nr:hypothetical protein IEO21_03602 [Postia placenta]